MFAAKVLKLWEKAQTKIYSKFVKKSLFLIQGFKMFHTTKQIPSMPSCQIVVLGSEFSGEMDCMTRNNRMAAPDP